VYTLVFRSRSLYGCSFTVKISIIYVPFSTFVHSFLPFAFYVFWLVSFRILLVISGFRRDVDEICALPEYYAVYSGNSLPTFRHNLAVPSSEVNNSNISWISWLLRMEPDRLSRSFVKELPLRCVKFRKSKGLNFYWFHI